MSPRKQREPKSTRKSPVASESIATHWNYIFQVAWHRMAQEGTRCHLILALVRRQTKGSVIYWALTCRRTIVAQRCTKEEMEIWLSCGLYHLHWRIKYFSEIFALNSLKLRFIFNSSFRFTAKLRGKVERFLVSPLPFPIIPSPEGIFVTRDEPHWHIVIRWRPRFILVVIFDIVHSIGLDTYL